ncbi:MAG TPA: PKD domain-containing protein [Bacteroidales bacterium]
MKNKKENINLRELYKLKLENAEIMPDSSVKSRLMHRVVIKEFMHFNPGNFNIYYLGGIMIAAITSAVILFSGSEASYNLKPLSINDKITSSDTVRYMQIELKKPDRKDSNISNLSYNKSRKSKISEFSHIAVTETAKTSKSPIGKNPFPTGISNSIIKEELFSDTSVDKNRLKGRFYQDKMMIEPFASEGCAPLKIRFHNKSDSNDSCRWTFGDGGYSNEKDPEWIFDVEGEYKVVLELFKNDGKQLLYSAIVKVHPRPQAHFEIYPEKAILPKDEIRFFNYSANAVHFKWDFGDGSTSELFEPRHRYKKFDNYNVHLTVFSDWGCSDSLTVINAFSGSEYFIEFPNAFIPNTQGPTGGYYSSKSDEAAQVFHPAFSGVSDYQLKIFSKLGILIFESPDINLGWDGYNKGELCEPGVYIWKVRGKFRNGEPFIRMGDVTLLGNRH